MFKRSSKLVIFASAEGGKRGGGGRQTPKQAATTAKAACEEEGVRQFDLPKLPLPPFPPSSFQGRRRGEEEEIPLPFFQKSFMG